MALAASPPPSNKIGGADLKQKLDDDIAQVRAESKSFMRSLN